MAATLAMDSVNNSTSQSNNNTGLTSDKSDSSNFVFKNKSKLNSRTLSLINNNNINNSSNLIGSINDYSLADIYEDAAVIGSELEKIINNYGPDILKDLMPKVINVLELLESLTIKNERENDELSELRMRVSCLESEKTQRINEKEKFEKELEEIEEKWKQETLKLIGMVNKLKEENKRLSDSVNQNSSFKQNEQLVIKQEELDYIRQIKEENIKLKEAVRYKDRELEQKNTENEGLQNQIESLSTTMLNFRRKQILAQNQIEKMVKIKTELECSLTEKDHQLNKMKERLLMKNINGDDSSPLDQSTDSSILNNSGSQSLLDTTNKLQVDPKDPNRPRFTLRELQKVLMEKNELTIKLDQTQDELEQLRKHELMNYGEVQGPINKEPDEKLDPSGKSSNLSTASTGIRRFFNFFLSSINSGANLIGDIDIGSNSHNISQQTNSPNSNLQTTNNIVE